MIADVLGVPKECAQITTGKTSAWKAMEINGLCESEVYRKLSNAAT